MDERKELFDELCKRKASDFEFAWNGFVRKYEDRKKETAAAKEKEIEYCANCSNERVDCVCMDGDDE